MAKRAIWKSYKTLVRETCEVYNRHIVPWPLTIRLSFIYKTHLPQSNIFIYFSKSIHWVIRSHSSDPQDHIKFRVQQIHKRGYSPNYKLAKENNLAVISFGKPNSCGKLSTQNLLCYQKCFYLIWHEELIIFLFSDISKLRTKYF